MVEHSLPSPGLLPPSPPAEKATARQDRARGNVSERQLAIYRGARLRPLAPKIFGLWATSSSLTRRRWPPVGAIVKFQAGVPQFGRPSDWARPLCATGARS